MLNLLSLLPGIPNKLIGYISAGVIFFGLLIGMYYGWESYIKQKALTDYNQQQLEQTLKDHQNFIEKQKLIVKQQQSATDSLAIENDNLKQKLSTANKIVSTANNKSNNTLSSEILRTTIQELQKSIDKWKE